VNGSSAHFEVHRNEGVAILSVSGEVDISHTEEYELARAEALDAGLPVVIDLENCEFIDSRGLQGIIQTFNLATERGQPFALAGSGTQVRRVLQVSGMANLLPYFRKLEDAVGHVRR
jgi:anti-sigma B factor antagonist